jgi:hypothetical protein
MASMKELESTRAASWESKSQEMGGLLSILASKRVFVDTQYGTKYTGSASNLNGFS